jgi:hypothetical protein
LESSFFSGDGADLNSTSNDLATDDGVPAAGDASSLTGIPDVSRAMASSPRLFCGVRDLGATSTEILLGVPGTEF